MFSRCASAFVLALVLTTGCGAGEGTDADPADDVTATVSPVPVPVPETATTPSPSPPPSPAPSPSPPTSASASPGGDASPSPTSRPGGGDGPTSSPRAEPVRLIVTAEAGTDAEALAADLRKQFGNDLTVDRVFPQTGQLVVTVASTERSRLEGFPGVAHAQEDRPESPNR